MIKSKPSVRVEVRNDITIVRFTFKPDPKMRARMSLHDFGYDFVSRKWLRLGAMTEAEVFAITRGDCQCSRCKGWWTK